MRVAALAAAVMTHARARALVPVIKCKGKSNGKQLGNVVNNRFTYFTGMICDGLPVLLEYLVRTICTQVLRVLSK